MRLDDLPAVTAIEKDSFPNPWPASTFLGEIQNRPVSHPYVAVIPSGEGERLVGFIIFWLVREEAQINNIAVHPEFRHRGFGEDLLRRALAAIRDLGGLFVVLEVRGSNEPAIRLYRKLGFSDIGCRKDYYVNPGEDALVMGLGL